VIDLMEALRASVAASKKKTPDAKPAAPRKRAAARK
jgi:non-homologous end joining protein Ku